LTGQNSVHSQTDGRGEPRKLNNFATVSHGILQTAHKIWQNLPQKTVGPRHNFPSFSMKV